MRYKIGDMVEFVDPAGTIRHGYAVGDKAEIQNMNSEYVFVLVVSRPNTGMWVLKSKVVLANKACMFKEQE